MRVFKAHASAAQTRRKLLQAPAGDSTRSGFEGTRRKRLQGLASIVEPALVVVATLSLWELATQTEFLPSADISAPSAIAASLVEDLGNPTLWTGVGATLSAWAIGLAIVVAISVPVGMLIGLSPPAYRATSLLIDFFRTIPSIAALPLLIFLYGVGLRLNILLVILTSLWPLLIQTRYGVRDVDPVARDTARVYGLSRPQQFTRIVLPSATPYMATGLRISGIFALLIAVAGSLIAGGEGLGALIADAARNGQTPLMYSRIAVAGFVGLVITFALMYLERRTLHWHASQRGETS